MRAVLGLTSPPKDCTRFLNGICLLHDIFQPSTFPSRAPIRRFWPPIRHCSAADSAWGSAPRSAAVGGSRRQVGAQVGGRLRTAVGARPATKVTQIVA
jgi:hypothetical protein